jgi:sialate O-acetylesterase
MQFAMPKIENATQEIQMANNYPTIRFFTFGQNTSSKAPLNDLQTIRQKWCVASNTTIAGGSGFSYFSAVCWIFGRTIFDKLGGKVPLGLVSSNWGGTPVEHWSPPDSFASCGRTDTDSTLYNAMIHPFVVGPMALTGFAWYQGEANTRNATTASMYSCLFPAMISGWRKAFNSPTAYFGYVQV